MKPSEMSELDIARAFVAWVDSEGKLEEPPHPRPYMMARALLVTADLLAGERRRVTELEAALAANNLAVGDLWRAAGCPAGEVGGSPAAYHRLFVALRDRLVAANVCLACGTHTPGRSRSCQCENDE